MERIKEQLSTYCDCVEKRGIDDKDINELISYVSMATCWDNGYCDSTCSTFLQGERREVIDLPHCMDCIYTFTPRYKPFVPESFTFTLVKVQGTEESSTPITDFSYSTLDCVFRINTGLPSCKCSCKTCGCEPEYKLLVEYIAGYEEIPDCLLPVFCNILEVIHEKNDCCCDRNCACDSNNTEAEYTIGDVVTAQVETDLGKLIAKQTIDMLGMMSVCEVESPIWGIFV